MKIATGCSVIFFCFFALNSLLLVASMSTTNMQQNISNQDENANTTTMQNSVCVSSLTSNTQHQLHVYVYVCIYVDVFMCVLVKHYWYQFVLSTQHPCQLKINHRLNSVRDEISLLLVVCLLSFISFLNRNIRAVFQTKNIF